MVGNNRPGISEPDKIRQRIDEVVPKADALFGPSLKTDARLGQDRTASAEQQFNLGVS